MALTVKQVQQLLRRRGALAALVTAAAVAVILVGQSLLREGTGFLLLPLTFTPSPDVQMSMSRIDWLPTYLAVYLPFAIGFFLSLWLVAPMAEELRIGHVITRAILATGIGATLVFVVGSVLGIIASLSGLPIIPSQGEAPIPQQLGYALYSALSLLITLLPLGVLAGVLLWHWRRTHPVDYAIEGLIDV